MQEKQEVNIYIETDTHNPKKRGGRYMYLMEYVWRNGWTDTRHAFGELDNATEVELALMAAIQAFGRMKFPSKVVLHTRCRHVESTVNLKWIGGWIKNGWKTTKNKPVKNKELWGILYNLMRPHDVSTAPGYGEYGGWMLDEMGKHFDSNAGKGKTGEAPLIGTETGKIYI